MITASPEKTARGIWTPHAGVHQLPAIKKLRSEATKTFFRDQDVSARALDGTGVIRDTRMVLPVNPWKMRATMGSSQSVPVNGSSFTLLNFDTAIYDSSNSFSPSSHAFTAPICGFYVVAASVDFALTGSPSAGVQYWATVALFLNGSLQSQGQVSAVTWPSSGISLAEYGTVVSDEFYMNAGDILDVRLINVWNAAVTVQNVSTKTYWAVHLVSG